MANLNLDKTRTAVLAVSFFKGTTANCPMIAERNTLGNARRVMEAARAAGVPVIHVVMGFRDGYPEVSDRNKLVGNIKRGGGFKLGSEQVELCDEVRPLPGEVVVNRPRINPFYNSELEAILRARGADTVAIMGVASHLPVAAAVRWAADADYRVILLEDCCASQRREDHDWVVQRIFPQWADVVSSDDFVESIR